MTQQNGNSLGRNLAVELEKICELDRSPDVLRHIPQEKHFPKGLARILAQFLELLGWMAPSGWFVAPFNSTHFRVEDPLIEVPRAVSNSQPSEVRIQFTAGANQTLMLKTLEIDAVNLTAAIFGGFVPADIVRGRLVLEGRIASMLGLDVEPGRFNKPQSAVKEDTGVFVLIFQNSDPFSVARFCLEVEGWLMP